MLLVLGGKQPLRNYVLHKWLEKKECQQKEVKKVAAGTASKPTLAGRGSLHNQKTKDTPSPAPNKKRTNEDLVDDEARKRWRLTSNLIAPKVWVPSLKEGKGDPILTNAKDFNDYVLWGKINRPVILLEDYDHTVAMEEKERQEWLDQARYLVH